jgi:outer membrane protein OmpA-like peptidoglycan-associated protein
VASADPAKNGCPKDTDGDRIADVSDACVQVPGVEDPDPKKNGCPRDVDADGIADASDACVKVPGVANADPKKNGCPRDTDSDGIADARDACVKVPGVENPDPSLNGCPKDTDSDGIADATDACLTVPGIANADPKKNGCPVRHGPKVVIQGNKVVIFEKVYFAFGKARILRRSYRILDDVATTLAEHPELARIRVEGHTDSKGRAAFNLGLSQKRAENVLRYLVKQGVRESRLEAVGYGDQRPVASNRTARGREANRRVELTIVPPPQVVERP